MLERHVRQAGSRFEYLGPLPTSAAPAGTVVQLLDRVDIWLAGTLQGMFDLIRH